RVRNGQPAPPILVPVEAEASRGRRGAWVHPFRHSADLRLRDVGAGVGAAAGGRAQADSCNQTWAAVLARKILGKLYPSLSRVRVDLSVKRAETSLSASLKRLGRERLDIL